MNIHPLHGTAPIKVNYCKLFNVAVYERLDLVLELRILKFRHDTSGNLLHGHTSGSSSHGVSTEVQFTGLSGDLPLPLSLPLIGDMHT